MQSKRFLLWGITALICFGNSGLRAQTPLLEATPHAPKTSPADPTRDTGLVGLWQGILPETKTKIFVRITKEAGHCLTATLDIPEKQQEGIPADQIHFEKGRIHLEFQESRAYFSAVDASFDGVLSGRGNHMKGQWSQPTVPHLALNKIKEDPTSSRWTESDRRIVVVQRDNGCFGLWEQGKNIGTIEPRIFLSNGQALAMKKDEKGKPHDGVARLPDGSSVSVNYSMKCAGSRIHIQYALEPSADIQVQDIRVGILLPYGDWLGDFYQLGDSSGTLPNDPSNQPLAQTVGMPITLGPAHSHYGLCLTVEAPGLQDVLLDNRREGGFLEVGLSQNGGGDKSLDWKKGEKKIFDFTLTFNHPTVPLLDLIEAYQKDLPRLKSPNTLSPDQLAWGETQLHQMLQDRPAMTPYAPEGSDLWNWAVRQFAGEYSKGGILWDPSDPKDLWDAVGTVAHDGEKGRIQVTGNSYISKDDNWGKPKPGPFLWRETVHEIMNVNFGGFGEFAKSAIEGKVGKEEFIFKSIMGEDDTLMAANGFFKKVWMPQCQKLSLPYTDSFMVRYEGGEVPRDASYEDLLRYEFREHFHYEFFEKEYDDYRAKANFPAAVAPTPAVNAK